MQLEAHGQKLATGLSWSLLPADNPKAEAARIAQDSGLTYGVIRAIPASDFGAFQVGLAAAEQAKGLPSAAAILASQYENLISGVATLDGRIWLCVVTGHQVVAGGDIVVSEEHFPEKFKSFLSDLNEAGISLDIFLDKVASDLVSDEATLEGEDVDDLFDLPFMQGIKRRVRIARVYFNKKLIFAGAAGVLVVGAVFMMLSSGPSEPDLAPSDLAWAPPPPKEDQEAKLLKQQQALEAALEEAKEQERQWLREDFNAADEATLIATVIGTWTSSPGDVQGGWLATGMAWSLGTPGEVEVAWRPAEGGTTLLFRESMQDIDIAFDGKGSRAITRHRIEASSTDIDAIAIINDAPTDPHVLSHALTYMGLQVQFEQPALLERRVPLKDIAGAPGGNTSLLRLSVMPFSISGVGPSSLAVLADAVELMPTGVIESITINPRNQDWKVSGVIYEN